MYKANGRLTDMYFNKSEVDNRIDTIKQLKKEFSREGHFEAFKHTSSYAEIPPISQTEDSGTYIRRKYKGVELVTLGATLYFVECKELNKYLAVKPKFLYLGNSGLRVIRADASARFLNEEGQVFQQELIKQWEDLVQPVFSYKHF